MITLYCILTLLAAIAYYKTRKIPWYWIEGWKSLVIISWVVITIFVIGGLLICYLP